MVSRIEHSHWMANRFLCLSMKIVCVNFRVSRWLGGIKNLLVLIVAPKFLSIFDCLWFGSHSVGDLIEKRRLQVTNKIPTGSWELNSGNKRNSTKWPFHHFSFPFNPQTVPRLLCTSNATIKSKNTLQPMEGAFLQLLFFLVNDKLNTPCHLLWMWIPRLFITTGRRWGTNREGTPLLFFFSSQEFHN